MIALALAGFAAPAVAAGDLSQPAIAVHYSNAQLATAEGRASIERQVRRAARNLCEEPGLKSAETYAGVRACMDEAWKGAARQIDLALSLSAAGEGERHSR